MEAYGATLCFSRESQKKYEFTCKCGFCRSSRPGARWRRLLLAARPPPNQPPTAIASETPKTITRPAATESSSAPPAKPEVTAKAQPEPSLAAAAKKDPATTSVLPLRPGEILDFTADVAKVSSVATLRLQTAEKRNFQGKSALASAGVCPYSEPFAHGFPVGRSIRFL